MIQKLTTPGGTRYILDKYGIRARKKYGQNFLTDASVVERIVEAAEITKEDCVLEIGPGIGSMTQLLSEAAGRVVCVEIDESLRPVLEETLAECGNVTVLWQDILKTDLQALREEYGGGRPLKVVANLPYYVTTPILLKLLESGTSASDGESGKGQVFSSITVMVQKEVAERIMSGPGSKEYGALSLAVQYYAAPQLVMTVPPSCFFPRPGVESSVLHLKAYAEPPVKANRLQMFALIRAAFNQRRKTLANSVSHGVFAGATGPSREEVSGALEQMGLSATVRGEALSLGQFAELTEILFQE